MNANQIIFHAPLEDDNPIPGLRGYQSGIYKTVRPLLKDRRAICVQLGTGAGKTIIFVAMTDSVYGKNKRAWIVVPRNELLNQASEHLRKWGVPHGRIHAKMQESRAFKIHVVSKDTLIRRYEKIKNWPDLLIFDEAHLYLDRQIEIISHLPKYSKIIGYTATPERLDGRGLSSVYNILVKGPEIPWLTDRGFLSPLKYFSPPLEGLADLKVRGNDYDEEQLEELLKRRKVYGRLVGHYKRYGRGKPALIFCRSVKSAYDTAERFRDKGYKFYCIEGKMSNKQLHHLLAAHRKGEIDGLTTCDLVLYGVDIPRVEYGASLRPTLSRAVYMQMIGRVLRPFTDKITGYKKEYAIWMDHVNMILEHQDEKYPGIPLHYVPEITWNFEGTKKRKRNKKSKNIILCPYLDFFYCDDPRCGQCQYNPDKTVKDCRKPMLVIPTELEEIKKPVKYNELPYEERREFQDSVGSCVIDYKGAETESLSLRGKGNETKIRKSELDELMNSALARLIKLADERGYKMMWVYKRLTLDNRKTVNVPLIYAIARIKGYKTYWAIRTVKFLKAQIEDKRRAG